MTRKDASKLIIFTSILFLIMGCSIKNVIVEDITLRENQQYTPIMDRDSQERLLSKIFDLLKQNENMDIELFTSDPKDRTPKKKGIRWYVQGGPMPAWAKRKSIRFSDVLYIDREALEIKLKIKTKETYLGIPIILAKANGVLSIEAPNRIKLSFKQFGTWMIVGTSVWKTEWLIDHIDLDKNVIGAYYAVVGGGPMCAGGGKGYLLAKFTEKPPVVHEEKKIKPSPAFAKPLLPPVTSKPPEKVAVAQTKERIESAPVIVEPEKPLPPTEITMPAEEPQIAHEEEKIKPAPVVVKPEKPLLPPILSAHVLLRDASGNQVLDSGEEVTLNVEVKNRGEQTAKDVRVVLSGNETLVRYLGKKKFIGDIGKGEIKSAEFKAVLPSVIARETAELRIEIKEMTGATHERKKIKVAMRPSEVKETVQIISELPHLVFTTRLKDQNNNRVLDGGEVVTLEVEVENMSEGAAKDVQVALSGNQSLIDCLGEDRFLGDIKSGEKKTATFKAVLPANIPSVTASLKIEIKESRGFSPFEIKVLKIAMRPVEVKEIVEIISEVNVDDIPKKIKGFENKDNVAIIIGISDYREKLIPTVKYAARDAEVIAKYLEKLGGIPRSNIKLLTDDTATKSDIEAYTEDWLPRRVNQDSTVFIYYAGHGTPDPQGREAYIVPYEGHPDFPSKLYPLKKMYEALNKLPAKDVVVMLDSCFSGAKGRSITREGARPITISIENPVLSGGKITVIAGSTGNQISSDYEKVKHGLFTYYLLRGIRGEADTNRNDLVELGELYRYVRTNVSERASLELNRDQTPVLLPSEVGAGSRLKIPMARTR